LAPAQVFFVLINIDNPPVKSARVSGGYHVSVALKGTCSPLEINSPASNGPVFNVFEPFASNIIPVLVTTIHLPDNSQFQDLSLQKKSAHAKHSGIHTE
jgi:hypothetical protein